MTYYSKQDPNSTNCVCHSINNAVGRKAITVRTMDKIININSQKLRVRLQKLALRKNAPQAGIAEKVKLYRKLNKGAAGYEPTIGIAAYNSLDLPTKFIRVSKLEEKGRFVFGGTYTNRDLGIKVQHAGAYVNGRVVDSLSRTTVLSNWKSPTNIHKLVDRGEEKGDDEVIELD